MVLPDGEEFVGETVVVLDHGHRFGASAGLEYHLVGVVFLQCGEADLAHRCDGCVHLLLPLFVQGVPVLVVVAGPLLEDRSALGDLLRIGDAEWGDVDVPVDDAHIEAERCRQGEDAGAERAHAEVDRLGTDAVERVAAARPVHGVGEPELGVLVLAGLLRGHEVVGVEVLPAFRAGGHRCFMEEIESLLTHCSLLASSKGWLLYLVGRLVRRGPTVRWLAGCRAGRAGPRSRRGRHRVSPRR